MGAIQMMNDKECEIFESTTLSHLNENIYDQYYQEAVFLHGREQLKKIEECIAEIHNELLAQLGISEDKDGKQTKEHRANYDYDKFFRSQNFKKLENEIQRVFGFRSVDIYPLKDEYNSKTGSFWYNCINAFTSMVDRYPIDGLVTDKGFYDKTHSISLIITFSNEAFRDLTPSQFVALMLHELGHHADPALVDIKYTQVNVLSKYLTDRKNKITNAERKVAKKQTKSALGGESIIALVYLSILGIMALLAAPWKKIWRGIVNGFKNLFFIKISESEIQERLDRIKEELEKDKKQFTRQEFSEAFADNFARMYGYGKELAQLFKKFEHDNLKLIKSWYSKERDRQEAIINMITYALQDEHKTEIERVNALIREYKEEINDKNTPKDIKKKLQEDLDELVAVYDSYTDDFDEFYKRCIDMMKEYVLKKDEAVAKKDAKNESFDIMEDNNDMVLEERTNFSDDEKKQLEETVNSINKTLESKLKKELGKNYAKYTPLEGFGNSTSIIFMILYSMLGFIECGFIYSLFPIIGALFYIPMGIVSSMIGFGSIKALIEKFYTIRKFQILGNLIYYVYDAESQNMNSVIADLDSVLTEAYKDILKDDYKIYLTNDLSSLNIKKDDPIVNNDETNNGTKYLASCIVYIDKKDNETFSKDFEKIYRQFTKKPGLIGQIKNFITSKIAKFSKKTESGSNINEEIAFLENKEEFRNVLKSQRMSQVKNKAFSIFPNKENKSLDVNIKAKCKKAIKKLYDDTKVDCVRLLPGEVSYEDKSNHSPTSGMLQFFINDKYDDGICKVIYHKQEDVNDAIKKDNIMENVPKSTLLFNKSDSFPIKGVHYLSPRIVPSAYNVYINEYSIDGKCKDVSNLFDQYLSNELGNDISREAKDYAYEEYARLNTNVSGTRIGGWPYFTQSDSRDKNHDIVLLEIDSEKDILWGDYGVANFFISQKNLINQKFDNVLFSWDCY